MPWFGTSTFFYSSPTLPSTVALICYFLDMPCCHLLFPCLVIPSGLHMTHPLHSGPRSSITSKTHITFPTNRLSLSLPLHSVIFCNSQLKTLFVHMNCCYYCSLSSLMEGKLHENKDNRDETEKEKALKKYLTEEFSM